MADTASKHIDMTTGSLWRNIPLFAFPVAATSILEQLSNLIATVIIGNFSGDQEPSPWRRSAPMFRLPVL